MDNTFRSYITEAIFSNVSQETFFEEDEEEEHEENENNKELGSKRLSSLNSNSFKSIAYIDDDIETEIECKDRQNYDDDDKDVYSVLGDENDEVFESSDRSFPNSTSDSEESFRTAPNTLSREEGVDCNNIINNGSLMKDDKFRNKKRQIFSSVGDIMTNISPGFTRKLSLRRLRGREGKYSDPGPSKSSSKWGFLSRSQSTKDFSRSKNDCAGSIGLKSNKTVEYSDTQSSSEYSAKLSTKNRKSSFSNNAFFKKNALKRTLTSCSVNSVISNFNRSLSFRGTPKRRSQSCRSLRTKTERANKVCPNQHIGDVANQNKVQRRYKTGQNRI